MGSSKTLSMVRQAYEYYLDGFKILSNMKLNFPHTIITSKTLTDFAKNQEGLYNTVLLLDELHIFMDSRRSASRKNLLTSYLILQTRKMKVKLLGTTQHRHQIDRRVRDNTDIFIDCEKMEIPTKIDGNPVLLMTNHIHTRESYEKIRFIGNKYFKLYNTEEIIFDDETIE